MRKCTRYTARRTPAIGRSPETPETRAIGTGEVVRDAVGEEEVFESPVFFGDGVAFAGGGCDGFFEAEDFLFEGFDVHFFAFAVGSVIECVRTLE